MVDIYDRSLLLFQAVGWLCQLCLVFGWTLNNHDFLRHQLENAQQSKCVGRLNLTQGFARLIVLGWISSLNAQIIMVYVDLSQNKFLKITASDVWELDILVNFEWNDALTVHVSGLVLGVPIWTRWKLSPITFASRKIMWITDWYCALKSITTV